MLEIQQIIGGKFVAALSGRTYDRIDPFTGAVATRAPASGLDDVKAAVAAASAAFPAWSKTGPGARRALLLKAADVLASKAGDFAGILTSETGGTAPWAGFNTMVAASMLREAASMTTQIQGEIIPADKPGTLAMAVRQAAGVCLGIAPWNAPIILGVRAIAMALACGNTVILKASEACPGLHILIGQAMVEAGLPDGVLNVVTGRGAVCGEALGLHMDIDVLAFTGSGPVGRRLLGLARGRLDAADAAPDGLARAERGVGAGRTWLRRRAG